MPNFLTIGVWYDPFELMCSLRQRLGQFKGEGGVRTLTLRGPRANAGDPDDEFSYVMAKESAKWVEARILLDRIRRDGAQLLQGELEFGRVYFEMLDAGAVVPWRRRSTPYTERFTRLHYGVRTNPASLIYSGPESINVLPGQLVAVGMRALHAAVNHGDHPRVHLLIDIRKKDTPVMSGETPVDDHVQKND